MTYEEFQKRTRKSTEKEVIINLIKSNDPCVVKLGKGRYELRDEYGNPFVRTKGLRVR